MPIAVATFLIPRSGASWFLLEDRYLKGGFQVRADMDDLESIPEVNRKPGMLVRVLEPYTLLELGADLVTWSELKLGGAAQSPTRQLSEVTVTMAAQAYTNVDLPAARSLVTVGVEVNAPCTLEVHGTEERADTNPYRFVATEDRMVDDGTTLLSDGTVVYGRRYNIWCNRETEPSNVQRLRVYNPSVLPREVKITVTWLPIEIHQPA